MRLDQNVLGEFVLIHVLVATEGDFLHLMPVFLIDGVEQVDLVALFLRIGSDMHVEEAFALKEVGQVLAPFLNQIGVDGALGEYGNQSFLPAAAQERNP